MSRLNQVLNENQKVKKEKKRDNSIPVYGVDGMAINPEKKRIKKKVNRVVIIIVGILCFLYLPGMIMSLISNKGEDRNYSVPLDYESVKRNSNMISISASDDFDGDGIQNDKEQSEGMNPWEIDSDGDHASDYYEMYISKTNPNEYSDEPVIEEQKKQDEANGSNVSTPYRMGNVILWADDYLSKAHGGVVETVNGYSFTDFTGYAQFPNDTTIYVYGIKDNRRVLLEHREEENAWRIDGVSKVEVYTEPLEEIVEVDIFNHPIYLSSNPVTKALSYILLEKGFISASQKTRMDVEPDTRKDTIAEVSVPSYDIEDAARFKKNTVNLSDLQYVRTMINEDRCVAVSLFNETEGEYIGLIYGYTYSGDLLIADINTQEPVGTINITEVGSKLLNDEGSFVYHTYFKWKGLGFSSNYRDRISFFAVADKNGNYMNPDDTDVEITTEESSEVSTEEVTTEADTTEELTTENTTEEQTTETTTEEVTTEATTESKPKTKPAKKPVYTPSTQAPSNNDSIDTPEFN